MTALLMVFVLLAQSPATQPATRPATPLKVIAELRAEIADLRAQVAVLKSENAELRNMLVGVKATTRPAKPDTARFENADRVHQGMSRARAIEIMGCEPDGEHAAGQLEQLTWRFTDNSTTRIITVWLKDGSVSSVNRQTHRQ